MPNKHADHVDLDTAMADGRQVFIGGPGDEPEEDGSVIVPAREKGADTTTDGDAVKKNDLPDKETVSTGDGSGASSNDKGKADKPHEDDKPRFTSHEEAEKGYRHLFSAKTKVEQELRDAKTRLENLEKEKEENARQSTAAQNDQVFLNYAAERREQALNDIDELDPESPDYRKAAATIWAKVDADIRKKDTELRSSQTAAAPAKEARQDATGNESQTEEHADEDGKKQVREYVEGIIEHAGFAKDDPLFWKYADQAPVEKEDGTPMDLDGQVQWCIDKTNEYRASVVEAQGRQRELDAEQRGREHADRHKPMGRSTALESGRRSPKDSEPPKRVSLDDAVAFSLDQRRL